MKLCNSKVLSLMAAAAFSAASGTAQADVIGSFSDLGGGVYSFDVTNNDAVDYTGFNFGGNAGVGDGGFSGNFLQGFGPGLVTFGTDPGGVAFGSQDTYFFGATPGTAINIVESTTYLEGAYDYGAPTLLAGQTLTVAIFSTSDNTAPTFVGGSASNTSTTVAITEQVVPEPTSLALLGLGGLLIARRRRS